MSSHNLRTLLHPFAVALFLGLFVLAAVFPLAAGELALETENDFLTANQDDDLYTFSIALGWRGEAHTYRLRENAFTDRAASRRFDETYLTIERELPDFRRWTGRAEVGVAHVGRGLFGESTQNAVHRVLGEPEVDLEYLEEERIHPYGRLRLERISPLRPRLAAGPVVEVQTAVGFKSSALAAWKAVWDAPGPFAFQATAGAKWVDTELEALSPWIHRRDAYAAVEIGFWKGFLLSWSYNAHGTAREHLAIGYRLGR